MSEKVYLNGRILSSDGGRISPLDRGLLYGDGFFETVRIEGGAPQRIERHLERLKASCCTAGFGDCVEFAAMKNGAEELIAANGVRRGRLRITLTRGVLPGVGTGPAESPTVLMQAGQMDLPPLGEAEPIVLAVSPWRTNERSPIVALKRIGYQANLLALAEARDRGADEALMLNSVGQIAEGCISNIFLVQGGRVLTPALDCGLLPGIMRSIVLEACRAEGIQAEEGAYTIDSLQAADEIFCTNALRGIMPVKRVLIDPEWERAARPVTAQLQRAVRLA
jgi:branched-subunit amino acid aminotransferase/4-amino-4-deoxychorismate lyase